MGANSKTLVFNTDLDVYLKALLLGYKIIYREGKAIFQKYANLETLPKLEIVVLVHNPTFFFILFHPFTGIYFLHLS